MLTAMTLYLDNQTDENYREAVTALNAVRIKEGGELASTLDGLFYLITDRGEDFMELNLQQARMHLDEAIEKSRKHHCQ